LQRARILSDLGHVYLNQEQLPKAEQAYLASLKIYQQSRDMINSAVLLKDLGDVYSLQHRDKEALSVLNRAIKAARNAPQDSVLMGHVLNSLGVVYFRQGKLNKAEDFLDQAVRTLPSTPGLYSKADLLNNLGVIYHAKRLFTKSEEYLLRALRLTEDAVGRSHPDLAITLSALALVYRDSGQFGKAEQQYERALAILGDAPVFESRIARLLQGLSRTYAAEGRKADAEARLMQAAAVARRNVVEHPDLASIMDEYAVILSSGGRTGEAEQLRAEAKRARATAGLVINAYAPF
jgi:tetratricopeptide (TPR) repeat protein